MTVQLVIRDGTPDWWESPDIWVVPGADPNGPIGTPVTGNPAYLWARVSNQGDVDAFQVQVDFWVANPSLQIRKSTSIHVGTSFADVAAGASQDVLCLVPWNVSLFNGGHECLVAEASSPSDPLNPPPADPDILDAPTYPQIAQRNLSVVFGSSQIRREIGIQFGPGLRADKTIDVEVKTGGKLSRQLLESLGLTASREAGASKISALLSAESVRELRPSEGQKEMRIHAQRGTLVPTYLSVASHEPFSEDEYAVVRVSAKEKGRLIGGVSIVMADGTQRRKKKE